MKRAISGIAGRWIAEGIDLLFPPACVLCSRDLAPSEATPDGEALLPPGRGLPPGRAHGAAGRVCSPCIADIVDASRRCPWCASVATDPVCPRCAGRAHDHDGMVVLGGYGGTLREAVLRAKRPAGRAVAAVLARLLHERHAAAIRYWRVDVVTPVPMHWWRRVLRGSSAADVIADEFAAAVRVPAVSLLRRRRCTVMQNRLPPERRRANVRDAFAVARGPIRGKRVLLVDDVVTTGGTIAACRKALVAAGAAAVHVAVIARAEQGSDDGASPAG